MKLKSNERLICAGEAALRAPDGTPLPAVPQYMIVTVDEADRARVAEVTDNERLILAGIAFNERKTAEERFAALKAGQDAPPRESGTPIYFKTGAERINPETGQTYEGEKVIRALSQEFAGVLNAQKRKGKAAARQGKGV